MKKLIQSTAAAALTVSGLLSSLPVQIIADEPETVITDDSDLNETSPSSPDSENTIPDIPPEEDPADSGSDTDSGQDKTGPEPGQPRMPAKVKQTRQEDPADKPAAQSDYDGLTGLTGNFERVENGYRLADTGGNNRCVSSLSAKSFHFAADIEYIKGSCVSFIFGINGDNFFGLELNNDNGNLKFKLFQDGGGLGDGVITYTPAGTATDSKAHLDVIVDDDNNLTVTVNGQVIPFTFSKDFRTAYTGGQVGLLTWQTEAVVSNIEFAGTDIPESQFRTNLASLRGLQGSWKETEDGLLSSGTGDNFAVSDTVARNVQVSATITNPSRHGAGSIAIRCSENPRDNGYFLNADYSAGIFKLFSFPSGATVAYAPMSSVPEDENGAYRLTLQMVDDHLRAYANDVCIIDTTDTQHMEAGRIALLTWDTTVTYQDVVYEELTELEEMEKPLLEDLEILTQGVHLNEPVNEAATLYSLDVPAEVTEFQVRPKASGTIAAAVTDRNGQLVRDLGEISDTVTLTSEDCRDHYLNLNLTVKNKEGMIRNYQFRTNWWISTEDLSQEEYRPQFHVTPQTNFMNDPNGMVYDSTDGYWHMFYQYQPHADGGGDQAWVHVRSRDMVNWEQMPVAIQVDDNGLIYSGCAIEDRNNTSGFFTDNKKGESYLIAYFTYAGPKGQCQGMAYSKDHGVTWIKQGVILDNEHNTLSGVDFRDPKVFQVAGDSRHWYMVTAGGAAQIFVSENLKDWTRSQNLTYKDGSQIHSECPMMFPAKDDTTGEELWIYGGSAGFYVVGRMEKDDQGVYKWTAISDKLDVESNANPWGGFGKYATMTFHKDIEGDDRTIGVSWLMDFETVEGKNFKGVQSLPQSYSLKKVNGKYVIVSDVVEEVNALRDTENPIFHTENMTVTPEDGNILAGHSGITYDLEGTFDVNEASSFGFRLRQGADGAIVFSYDKAAQKMILDLRNAGTHRNSGYFTQTLVPDANGKIHLRLIVDQGAVEAFGNHGEANISTILYAPSANMGMEFFTDGSVTIGDLNIYEMKSMYSGQTKADSTETKLYVNGPSFAETGQAFRVTASLYPDKEHKGVEWILPDGVEAVSMTGTTLTARAEKPGDYEIAATAKGQEPVSVKVHVADVSFDNNAAGDWTSTGSWTADDKGLHGLNAGSGDCFHLSQATVDWTKDFTLSSNVNILKGQAAGIVFGVRDPQNPGAWWMCANIDRETEGGIFKMFVNTGSQGWAVTRKLEEIPAKEDGSYDLEVRYQADNSTLTYLANGEEIGSHVLSEGDRGRPGVTGYVTYHADASFNGFHLESEAGLSEETKAELETLQETLKELPLNLKAGREDFLKLVPDTLYLVMDNGTVKTVSVDWNTDHVDFGSAGTYQAAGTADGAALEATVVIRNEADLAALQEALQQAGQLKEGDYSSASWKTLDDAVKAASAVMNADDPSQGDVDAARELLTAALDGLELAVPADRLEDLEVKLTSEHEERHFLARVPSVLKVKMTSGQEKEFRLSWDTSAVKFGTPGTYTAYGTLQDPEGLSLLAETDQVPDHDIKASVTIVAAADKTDLEKAVREGQGLNQDSYTEESWKVFQEALRKAEEILADEFASQKDVDAAKSSLDAAQKQLKQKAADAEQVSKDKLATQIKAAQALKESEYTADSWKILTEALKNAQAVLENADASQSEVNEAQARLTEALGKLVKKTGGSTQTAGGKTSQTTASGTKTAVFSMAALWTGLAAAAAGAAAWLRRRNR